MLQTKPSAFLSKGAVIVAVTALAQFASTFAQYQLPPIQQDIIDQVGLTQSQYVQCYTAPMLPAVLLALCAGVLVDRMGPKPVIGTALIFSAAGSAARIFCHGYLPYLLAMAMTGIAPAFIHSSASKIMGQWFPRERVSFAIGLMMLGGSAANFVATSTTALLPSTLSVYLLGTALCVVSLALWVIFMKNTSGGARQRESSLEGLRRAVRSKTVWLISLCMLFNMGFYMTVASSAPNALQSLGYTPETASLIASALSIGSPLGCRGGSDRAWKSGNPKRFMQVVIVVGAVGMPLLWSAPSPALSAIAVFAAGFCYGTCQVTIMAIPARLDEIGHRFAGTAGGMLTTVQMVGAILLPSRVFVPLSGGDYNTLFLIASASLVFSFLLLFAVKIDARVREEAQ